MDTAHRKPGVSVYMKLHPKGRQRLATLICVQEVRHRDLAAAVGWSSHGMVGHLLAGRRTGVRPEHALALARYLGVDVSDLFATEIPAIRSKRKTGRGAPAKSPAKAPAKSASHRRAS